MSKIIIRFTVKSSIITGLPGKPSHKMGFRSSVSKSGHPGEGKHKGLVLRNDVLTNGFIGFSLDGALHGYFLYLSCAPLEKPTRRCEPEEGYLRCSKRLDHGSHSIIFLLFEFKSDDVGAGKLREMLALHSNRHAVHGRFTLKD